MCFCIVWWEWRWYKHQSRQARCVFVLCGESEDGTNIRTDKLHVFLYCVVRVKMVQTSEQTSYMCFCIVWWEWRWYKHQNRQATCVFVLCGESEDGTNFRTDKLHVFLYCVVRVKMVQTSEQTSYMCFCIVWWEWRWYKLQNRQATCVFVLCGESEDGTNIRADKLDVFLYCVVRVKMVQTSEQTSYMCFCIVWWEWRWYKLQNRQARCVFVLCGESEDGTNIKADKLDVFLYCVVRVKMVQTSEQTSYMCFCIVWWEWRWYKHQNRQATCVFVLCGESEDGTNFRTDKLDVFLYCVVRVKMVQTSEQTSYMCFCIVWWEWRWYKHQNRQATCVFVLCGESEDGTNFRTDKLHVFLYCVVRVKMVQTSEQTSYMCFCIVWWEWRWYKLQNRQARCVFVLCGESEDGTNIRADKLDVFLYCVVRVKMVQTSEQTSYMCFCIVWWEWRWYKHQNRQATCVFVLCGESEDGTNFRTDKLDVFLYCVVRVKMVQTSEQTSYMCFCVVWWEWRWYKLQNRQARCVFVLCGERYLVVAFVIVDNSEYPH